MYEVGDTPTMEIILASNSFSEALDQLENMSWIEKQIEEKIESIEKAKKSIEDNLAQQKREKQKLAIFNSELETEKAGVSFHLAQKNSLLAQTEGQEEKYREYLVKAEKEFQRVQAQITSLLAVESYVSQGSVKRGQVIGFQGSTGFSTGPHLHFGVYIGNQDVDPIPYLNSGRLSWPFDSFIITQYYWGDFSHRGRGWPGGLDLVSYPNAPVKAAADGEIILNIRQNWGFGHYIVIEHGDGLRTLYAHLQ